MGRIKVVIVHARLRRPRRRLLAVSAAALLVLVSPIVDTAQATDSDRSRGSSAVSTTPRANGPGIAIEAEDSARGFDEQSTLDVLVLGDSYSAGNGAGDYEGAAGCWRSPHNYGGKFGELNDAANSTTTEVDTYACNGAVTQDFWKGKDGRPPMFDWVKPSYDTIFLTIGGNDIHFGKIVIHCFIKRTRTDKHCDPNLDYAEEMLKGTTLRKDTTKVLKGIRKRAAPGTRIVLLGYPYLEANDSSAFMLDDDPVGARVRKIGVQGNKMQKAIVAELNTDTGNDQITFLSTQALFAGKLDHAEDSCGLSSDSAGHFHELQADANNRHRWMVQPVLDASFATRLTYYHPNPMGWCQEAQLLLKSGDVPTSPFRYDGGPITLEITAGSSYSIPLPLSGGVLPVGLRPEGNVPAGVSASVNGRVVTLGAQVSALGDYSFSLNATDDAGKVVPLQVSLRVVPYVPGDCGTWGEVGVPITITAGGWVSWGNDHGSGPILNSNLSAYSGTIHYGDGASESIALNNGPYKHTYNFPGTYNARIVADGTLKSTGRPCHDDVVYPVVVNPASTLYVGQTLPRGSFLRSPDGRYTLQLQTGDGNLVLYNSAGQAIWTTGKLGGARLVLQGDSNLVQYRADGVALWASSTVGRAVSRLVVQSDGNMVLYTADHRAVWSTNTVGR